MAKNKEKQYIYIVQSSKEITKCKIGKTNNLERRLKEYNSMTGKSKENTYQYLFTCEVKNMTVLENSIKETFNIQLEENSREIYFYNKPLFRHYIEYIKLHPMFVKEIFIKTEVKKEIIKIVKKTTPTLEERGLSQKDIMQKAQKIRNDEFYTKYDDVEKELSMYNKNIWKDKTVFCNCDDAVGDNEVSTSAFALYFIKNFKNLELKKLICTHYSGVVDLFNQGAKGYIFTKTGYKEFKEYPEGYTGSFRHPLSIKILKEEADIVCTNPPFSKASDFWRITIESKKKFLIISNIAVVLTTAYLHYFKDKKVWAGFNEVSEYLNHKREIVRAAGYWFTNIPVKNRPKYKQLKLMPLKEIPKKYIKYDDAKMLIVDNNYIPIDYKKHFAISVYPILSGILEKGYKIIRDNEYYPYINGKRKFGRVLIQKEI